MKDFLLPVFCACATAFSFAVLCNIRGKKLIVAGLCGALSWAVYLISGGWFSSVVVRSLAAIVATSVCAEVMARVTKTPVVTYLVPGLIPLVPGTGMYDTMERMIKGDISGAVSVGINTLGVAAALGLGIVMVSSLFRIFTAALQKKSVDKPKQV